MAFGELPRVPPERAIREYMEILARNGMAPQAETAAVADAAGRITAGPVYARACVIEMVLPSYSLITPPAIGAMLAGGISEVMVIKRPVVGIVAQEMGHMGTDPSPCVPSPPVFSAMLRGWGADTVVYTVAGNGPGDVGDALGAAVSQCDAVVLCAGSAAGGLGNSAGGLSNTADAIAAIGTVVFDGLAIKPGELAVLGHCGPKPVVGVPGCPVSGAIVMEQLLRPIIGHLSKKEPEPYRYVEAWLSRAVVSAPDYHESVRVRLGFVRERFVASPLGRGSGAVASFMGADGIVEVPLGVGGYKSGGAVNVRLLRPEREIRRSLVVIGSHDPLLDELAELLRVGYGDISVCSAHVGSMGGLLALRRGEAHLAGTHLLDEKTGEYNGIFVRKMLPKGGVRLVECVKRMQGLILPRGNPDGITGFTGLLQGGLRFVNRQKGSGTRILTDYLCRVSGVDTLKINGYDREEFTHSAVAALVAAGSADAGVGVYSAARQSGLDFVPVCREQYDLLIPDHAWDLPMVQKLLLVLKSDAFRRRLEAMGGYEVDNPGAVREVF